MMAFTVRRVAVWACLKIKSTPPGPPLRAGGSTRQALSSGVLPPVNCVRAWASR